jgi:NADPH:quinone reductase-like Zn-dependent oxidoreductase
MKALLCREMGPLEDLALEEVSSPIAGNGQMVVAVKASRARGA